MDSKSTADEGQAQPRGLPSQEKPYCWQNKAALRKIEGNPLSRNKAHTLLTYLAFTWIASDKQETTFQATKQFLCDKAGGIGRRTIEYALDELEQLGLIRVHREKIPNTKGNAVNTYTLLSLSHIVREGNAPNARASRTGRGPSHARNQKKVEHTSCVTTKKNKDEAPDGADSADTKGPQSASGATKGQPCTGKW